MNFSAAFSATSALTPWARASTWINPFMRDMEVTGLETILIQVRQQWYSLLGSFSPILINISRSLSVVEKVLIPSASLECRQIAHSSLPVLRIFLDDLTVYGTQLDIPRADSFCK